MSKKDIAYAEGRVQGIIESGWQCNDCGNYYDTSTDECPNRLLDEALAALRSVESHHRIHKGASHKDALKRASEQSASQFGYRATERTDDGKAIIIGPYDTREEAEAAADGLPIVELAPAPAEDSPAMADFGPVPRPHRIGCPCEDGPCCPWMEDCACQCMCDFIARMEDRIRSEYDPSEIDADEGYRTGYATAVSEFMSNHGDDATFQLGYKKALLDVIERARTEPGAAFATVEELMKDLNEDTS